MKWWRIRKVANAATWHLLMIALGMLAGIALVAFLPGMPWSSLIEPVGVAKADALDLAAQRSMASAAWFMVAITGVSVGVGGVGLYLIGRTLQEAKRSADAADKAVQASLKSIEAAREMGRAQVRAYVSISGCWLSLADDGTISLKFIFRNSGQTPAANVWTHYRLYVGPIEEEALQVDESGESRSDLAPGQKRKADFDVSNGACIELASIVSKGRAYVYAEVEVLFDDVFHNGGGTIGKYYAYLNESGLEGDVTLYRDVDES